VIIEGLYAFLGIDPWKEAGEMLDERWFVELDEAEARQRLVKRHVLTGIASTLDAAFFRADDNDMPSTVSYSWNHSHYSHIHADGRFIIENMLEPTRRIQSVEDPVLAAAAR
jgi:pantothenate kinase